MSKYKAVFVPGQMNEEFWKEVLVDRKIESINFDQHGISSLKLDSGETLFLPLDLKGGRIAIQD